MGILAVESVLATKTTQLFLQVVLESFRGLFGIGGLEYWTGTLDWITGMTFDFQITPGMHFQAEKA